MLVKLDEEYGFFHSQRRWDQGVRSGLDLFILLPWSLHSIIGADKNHIVQYRVNNMIWGQMNFHTLAVSV